ncbi:MAG: type VI secretion system-associated FHA domain protein TagH [Rhizobiaceae bacterium]|nr:type VI secretion system-associated FHA domain protein TagH [Rhizobiaceae bacterium]
MTIRLTIENVDRLPNGGPPSFSSSGDFRIGRENCDWVLPDPDRFISGVHCEVRAADGGYWLADVSRNGTFLNGAGARIASPHRLAEGDRLRVGRYVISVAIEEAAPVPKTKPFGEPSVVTPPVRTEDAARILRDIAAGAGVSPDVFLQRDPQEVAAEIGVFLRIVVDELALLLKARAAAKVLARSTDRTILNSTGNNPLKFVPGTEEMLEKMFARRSQGYLDARRSLEDAFGDLKTHELATYAAMQSALAALLDELSPEAVERRIVSSAFASKKARAWDAYVKVWENKEQRNENGMLDAFLEHFSEAYAKASRQK